tara:strand:- start:395 stop:946 length:552 start_codon:yes stop_codon:yes gene_type:complete
MTTSKMNKAFFLDRDGVINIDGDYVSTIEDFQLIDGVFEACKIILSQGYKIIIITNQSGIGRGYYTEEQFFELNRWMIDKFKGGGIHLTDVYFCPHHPTDAVEPYNIDCECRKPKPGMIQKAKVQHDIDLVKSVLVGDRLSDITSGKSAGVGTLYLVSDGKKVESDAYKCHSLLDAVQQFFNL